MEGTELTTTNEKLPLDPSNVDVISICDSESDSDESSASLEIIETQHHVDVIELDDTVEDYVNGDNSVISIKSDPETTVVHFELDTAPDFIPVGNYGRGLAKLKTNGYRKRGKSKSFVSKDSSPDGPGYRNYKKRKLVTLGNDEDNGQELRTTSRISKLASRTIGRKRKGKKLTANIEEKSSNESPEETTSTSNPKIQTRIIQLSYPNILNDKAEETRTVGLRPIIIDGCNVGFGYGNGSFAMRGNILVIQYFKNRGHDEIVCFLPQTYRHRTRSPSEERTVVGFEKENMFSFTPSRKMDNGKRYTPYDDRYILQYATERQGVIISNDGYRDLINEEHSWRETIEKRIVNYTFARGIFMLPKDPLGPSGPTLDEMLKFPGE